MENKTKKDAKQKSFFFEDYNESELIVNDNKINHAKISLNRITFLFFIFLSLIIIFSAKIIYLSLSPEKSFFSDNINHIVEIYDINGKIIISEVSNKNVTFDLSEKSSGTYTVKVMPEGVTYQIVKN